MEGTLLEKADEELPRLKWFQKEKLAEEERKLAQGKAELRSLGAARMAAEDISMVAQTYKH